MRKGFMIVLGTLVIGASVLLAQSSDPRTAEGQLAVCGGASTWQSVGFLEFDVKIQSPAGVQGPWNYKWGRFDGVMRVSGIWPGGGKLDVVLDLASRTGGAWEDGKQLSGKRLEQGSNWAFERFGEDVLWLTFPLEWGASGMKVTPQPGVTEADGQTYPATQVDSPRGVWTVLLDPASGRMVRSVLKAEGAAPLTMTWESWKQVGGVYFAQKRTIAETGETVEINVLRALPSSPPDAF